MVKCAKLVHIQDVSTLAYPGGPGARPPDPQIWRPQLYNLEAPVIQFGGPSYTI